VTIETCNGSQLAKAAEAIMHNTTIATNTLAFGRARALGQVLSSTALCTYSSPGLFCFFSGMMRRIRPES
jgi:hypothetical protein